MDSLEQVSQTLNTGHSASLFLLNSILPFLTFSIVATLGLIFTVLVPLPSKMIKIIWFYKLCHLFLTWQEGNFQSHLAHSFPGLGLISIEAETVELKGAAKMKSSSKNFKNYQFFFSCERPHVATCDTRPTMPWSIVGARVCACSRPLVSSKDCLLFRKAVSKQNRFATFPPSSVNSFFE